MEKDYHIISNVSDQTKWEKFIYTKIDMTSTNEDFLECSFYCTHLDENCDTFLYENYNCYIGQTSHSVGNGTSDVGISTIFLTDSALTNYVVPLTTTYCCVEASKFKEHFGNFQIDVKSGTAVPVRNGTLTRIVLYKIRSH